MSKENYIPWMADGKIVVYQESNIRTPQVTSYGAIKNIGNRIEAVGNAPSIDVLADQICWFGPDIINAPFITRETYTVRSPLGKEAYISLIAQLPDKHSEYRSRFFADVFRDVPWSPRKR